MKFPKKYKGALCIYFDYELQKGNDSSKEKNKALWKGQDDYYQTKIILDLLKKYNVKATFAILGHCAKKGKLPYHAPEQIKLIAKKGHEIASHSQNHEHLPDLSYNEVVRTLTESKYLLEELTKKKVQTFVPPYNSPVELYSQSLNIKTLRKSKLSIGKLCHALAETGYKTIRLTKISPLRHKVFNSANSYEPKFIGNVMALTLNASAGFSKQAKKAVDHAIKQNKVAVVYGHPHSLAIDNEQNATFFENFLQYIKGKKELWITTPSEIYKRIK